MIFFHLTPKKKKTFHNRSTKQIWFGKLKQIKLELELPLHKMELNAF